MSAEESAGTNSAKPLDINVVALRQALRLIHCLQKERGASCAYHASTSLFHKHLTVEPARRDTDRALRKASMCMNSHNARAVLEKIRKATQSQGVSYHRILATYNCLISAIVHDGIWKHTNTQRVKSNDHNDSSSSSTVKHDNVPVRRHRRVPSSSDVLLERDKSSSLLLDKKKPVHRRLQSENFRGRLATDPTDYSFLTSEMIKVDGVSDQYKTKTMARIDSIGSEPLEEPAETAKGNPQASSIDTSVNNTDSEAPNLSRLLTLLDTFVALKESIGVERATLCSILAAGPESHHLLNVSNYSQSRIVFCVANNYNGLVLLHVYFSFVNSQDMVLEVENQRRLVQKLLKSKVGSLCHGVRDLVVMSPELEEIQQRLLAGKTDGIGQEIDSHNLWNMLTVYIDKLHSFELLILEEIEYALEESKDENGQEGVHWSAVFGKYDRIEKLKDIVESSPPDDVKGKVMAALRNEVGQHFKMPEGDFINVQTTGDTNDGNTSEENRLDVMLKELSSYPQSKEWEIDLYQIRFKKRIGQGAAGTTYMADWGGTRVAVKVASITEMGLEGWRTEVQALQKLHHPNIIRLLGSVYHPNPLTFCLVLEYCDAGDLDTAMQRVTPRNFVPHVALSMAKGMAYLHKRGIIRKSKWVVEKGVVDCGMSAGRISQVPVLDNLRPRCQTAQCFAEW